MLRDGFDPGNGTQRREASPEVLAETLAELEGDIAAA
jgi:hypothetical protein